MDDTGDTMVVLLARMEALESENSLLHESMEALQETVDVLNTTVLSLQNTTNDRLQEIEIDLQGKFVHVYLRLIFLFFFLSYLQHLLFLGQYNFKYLMVSYV